MHISLKLVCTYVTLDLHNLLLCFIASNSISMDTTNSSVEFAHTHFNRDDELVSIELVPDPALTEAGLLQVWLSMLSHAPTHPL